MKSDCVALVTGRSRKFRCRIQLLDGDSKKSGEAGKSKIGDIHQTAFNLGNAAARDRPAGELQSGSQDFLRPTALVTQPANLPSDDVQLLHVTYAKRPFILIMAGRFSRTLRALGVARTQNGRRRPLHLSPFSAVKTPSCAKSYEQVPGAGRRVKVELAGRRGSLTLTRCPATYNGTLDSRARLQRDCALRCRKAAGAAGLSGGRNMRIAASAGRDGNLHGPPR